MTSGHKLTERQRDSILRLIGYQREGIWLLTYDAVAHELSLDSKTVSECVRMAAANWGRHTRWHDAPNGDSPDLA
jgi:hypothetical protein